MGLLASDEMNLGLEKYLRERQATAVARLGQPSTAQAGTALGSVEPLGALSGPGGQAMAGAPSPSPVEVVETQAVTSQGAPTPPPEPQGATGQGSGSLASSPLVLSDPEFDSLGQVDAEMAQSAVGRRVQIRYGEAALNREIAILIAQSSDLGFRDVQVNLDPDKAVVTGDVTVMGFDVGARVEGVIIVENCLPRLDIRSVSVGGFLTPGFVKDEVTQMVLGALDWYPPDSALCLEQIVLENGMVTVYGYRR